MGGTLFRAEAGASLFSVGLYQGQVGVQWRLGAQPAQWRQRRMRTRRPPDYWVTLRLTFADGHIRGTCLDLLLCFCEIMLFKYLSFDFCAHSMTRNKRYVKKL